MKICKHVHIEFQFRHCNILMWCATKGEHEKGGRNRFIEKKSNYYSFGYISCLKFKYHYI